MLDLLYRNELNFLNHLSQLNQFPIGIDTLWHQAHKVALPNSSMADWLLHTGSLTERLQSLTSHFSVEVIGQETMEADASEQAALPDYQAQRWQIREVVLYGGNKPWVFARSVLPEHLCKTTWATLGSQPLGQRIFNDDQFVRSDFLIAQLDKNPLAAKADSEKSLHSDKKVSPLWARRSQFQVHQWQLLVAEVFLPDCPCYEYLKAMKVKIDDNH